MTPQEDPYSKLRAPRDTAQEVNRPGVYLRLHHLRGWSHEEYTEVLQLAAK